MHRTMNIKFFSLSVCLSVYARNNSRNTEICYWSVLLEDFMHQKFH